MPIEQARKWLPLIALIRDITGIRLRTGDLVSETLVENSFTIRPRSRTIERNGKTYRVASRYLLSDERERFEEFVHVHPEIIRSRTWPG